jgi:hypothetical protein
LAFLIVFRIFATYEILGRYLVKEYKRIVC